MRAAWAAAALVAWVWLAVPAEALAQRGRREDAARVDGGVKRRVRHRRSDAGAQTADAGTPIAAPVSPIAPKPDHGVTPQRASADDSGTCCLGSLLLLALVPVLLAVALYRRHQRRIDAAWAQRERERHEAEERERRWAEERAGRARQRLGAWPPDMPIERVVAIDVETTSRDTEKARVVEIAFVTSDGRRHSSLVNPGVRIPKAAFDIHGITNDDVAGAPTFIEAWDRARELGLLDGFYPLAYHAPYDQRVVATELARAGRVDEANDVRLAEWVDPCVAVQAFDHGSARLVEACTRRRIRVGRMHRALGDAQAALDLWRALERERPRFTVQPLEQAIAWQLEQRAENDARRGR